MDSFASMKIIEDMLYTAKKEVKESGAFFLLWGWLVFMAAIGQSIIHWLGLGQESFAIGAHVRIAADGITWAILMPLGAVISIFMARRQQKQERVRTWFDDVMKYLWIAFGVMLFIILFSMSYLGLNLFPLIIALYGLGLFVTGGALKFRPLLTGGIICWVLSFTSLFVAGEYVTLCLALSILAGYIIPGYMLKHQSKEKSHVQAA